MRFSAQVIPSGNATAVEIPGAVAEALGPQARPPIAIAINGHGWRSRVAIMRGMRLIGISAANQAAAGIREGDIVEIEVEIDAAAREVDIPDDLHAALAAQPGAKAAFERLPFGLKRKHVGAIEDARRADVRQRRIDKLVAGLCD